MHIIRIDKTQGNLVFELFDKYRVFYKQPTDLERAKSFVQARLDHNESVIFVALAEDGKTPVGFTQLYPTYSSVRTIRNWILNDLYVEQDYRKHGVGAALIDAAIDFARNGGSRFVELSTAIDNYTAQSLYEKIGFRKQAPETDFYTYRFEIE